MMSLLLSLMLLLMSLRDFLEWCPSTSGPRTHGRGLTLLAVRGQFHQHSTSSFYGRRSQKRQKDSQVKQFFALLGSACVKDVHKHVDKIDYRWLPS